MIESKYFKEIKNVVENLEATTQVRRIQDNIDKLKAYHHIGSLIVEAQGGDARAKYGDTLIKKWSDFLSLKYGKNYSYTNLKYMRQFSILFPISHAVRGQLTWTHYRCLLSIKNENERNYYINQIIQNNLSTRELQEQIKNKSFDRLAYADKENVKLIDDNNYNLTIKDMIKDPILLKTDKETSLMNEKVLHKLIINMLETRFIELGMGFALMGHEYKISVEGHTYYLDLLFFNVKLNSFVVVEIKTKSMKIKDCDQLFFYTKLVDKYVRESFHNKTIGLLIVREHDSFVLKYATDKDIIATKYKIIN